MGVDTLPTDMLFPLAHFFANPCPLPYSQHLDVTLLTLGVARHVVQLCSEAILNLQLLPNYHCAIRLILPSKTPRHKSHHRIIDSGSRFIGVGDRSVVILRLNNNGIQDD